MNPTNPPDNSSSTTDCDDAPPTYMHVEPRCPVCGNSRFASTEEGIPNGYDAHYVHPTCANCHTVLTIEYRPIDLSWTDSYDEHHSAVSQGLLEPTQIEYGEASMYAPLPDSTLLEALDWPCHCKECMELLTGNDLVTEPSDRVADESEVAESTHVQFDCPNCHHRSTHTPTDSP